jgi:hypothetical protein
MAGVSLRRIDRPGGGGDTLFEAEICPKKGGNFRIGLGNECSRWARALAMGD